MKTIIAIDPGSKGFITVSRNGNLEFISIEDNTPQEISHQLRRIEETSSDIICVMEEIHAIFGSSAGATFSFGKTFGLLQGILIASEIPYHLVPPKKWQEEIWINSDKVWKYGKISSKTGKPTKTIDTKPTSLNAARRLFPSVDLRRSERCKKEDDNKADSLLLMEYARRKNL